MLHRVWEELDYRIGVSRGGQRGHGLLKVSENILILCFERHFPKQNSVIRLKSNILAPPKFLGWLRHWTTDLTFAGNRRRAH